MKYAVIETGGKQYKVHEDEKILIDRLHNGKNTDVEFTNVLMVRDDDNIAIGTPYVQGVKIKGKILALSQGPKIRVSKFKAKVHYRRTTGFRSKFSDVLIEKI